MRREGLLAPLLKSAAFIVVTVVVTVILGLSIAQTGAGSTDRYAALFTDASGLTTGDSVRVAGVSVGRVEGVSVADRHLARVTLSVRGDQPLPASVTASIKYFNLVGQRYVELDQGTGAAGVLRPGGTIGLDHTNPSLNLTQVFNGFQPLFQALSPGQVNQLSGELISVLQGEGSTVTELLSTVGSLTTTIATKDKVIGQVIDNLTTVVDTVNARGDELSQLIGTVRSLVSGLAADREPIGQAIGAMDALTTSTAGLLKQSRPAIRTDIGQLGRLSTTLDQNSATIQKFLDTWPTKEAAIARIASYGSWLNLFLCQATVSGVTYQPEPGETTPPAPTGVLSNAARCSS